MMRIVEERYATLSESETQDLGRRFAQSLKAGDSVSLEGDLGAGKTAFVKGMAVGLGITETVTSPTFTIVNTYEGNLTLHHFDVYRIDDPGELLEIGWDEYFGGDAVCVVEWGDRFPEMLPSGTIRTRILRDEEDPQKRSILIERRADEDESTCG